MSKLIIKMEYDKHDSFAENDWTLTFDVNENTTASEVAEMLNRVMHTMEYHPDTIDKYFYWDDDDDNNEGEW